MTADLDPYNLPRIINEPCPECGTSLIQDIHWADDSPVEYCSACSWGSVCDDDMRATLEDEALDELLIFFGNTISDDELAELLDALNLA